MIARPDWGQHLGGDRAELDPGRPGAPSPAGRSRRPGRRSGSCGSASAPAVPGSGGGGTKLGRTIPCAATSASHSASGPSCGQPAGGRGEPRPLRLRAAARPRRPHARRHLVAVHIQACHPVMDLFNVSSSLGCGDDPPGRTWSLTESGVRVAATIPGPAGPAPDLLRSLSAPVSRRRPRPASLRGHFITPGRPPGHAGLFLSSTRAEGLEDMPHRSYQARADP